MLKAIVSLGRESCKKHEGTETAGGDWDAKTTVAAAAAQHTETLIWTF